MASISDVILGYTPTDLNIFHNASLQMVSDAALKSTKLKCSEICNGFNVTGFNSF